MTTDAELEQRFVEHGIPRRHLYPVWYRINRGVGLRHKSPVLLSLIEHYLFTLPTLILAMGLGALIYWGIYDKHLSSIEPLLVAFLLIPAINWIRYRNIRRRIGLTGNSSTGE